jgi:hypothetical protein
MPSKKHRRRERGARRAPDEIQSSMADDWLRRMAPSTLSTSLNSRSVDMEQAGIARDARTDVTKRALSMFWRVRFDRAPPRQRRDILTIRLANLRWHAVVCDLESAFATSHVRTNTPMRRSAHLRSESQSNTIAIASRT